MTIKCVPRKPSGNIRYSKIFSLMKLIQGNWKNMLKLGHIRSINAKLFRWNLIYILFLSACPINNLSNYTSTFCSFINIYEYVYKLL